MQLFKIGDKVKRANACTSAPYGVITKVRNRPYKEQLVDVDWSREIKWYSKVFRQKVLGKLWRRYPSNLLRGLNTYERQFV